MGLFGFLSGPDINKGVEEWKNSKGSYLIDVRTKDEYKEGHIPGSINIPLNEIDKVIHTITNRETKVFVHCLSGSRSSQATSRMKRLGYTDVVNIGGISNYKGKVEV
mgnify:CR=1 FL=1